MDASTMLPPEVSVLLTSWNTREQTQECLTSLHRVARGLRYEVIAVDNASGDGSAELLAADPRVRLISNPTNLGFAAAVNQGFRVATGELLLILNSDVSFHDDSLPIMVDFLREHPEAAGVSPHYRNPDGSFQQHYIQLPSFAVALTLFTALRRLPGLATARDRYDLVGVDFSVPQPYASASCLLLRAAVVGRAEVFDEQFPIFWNDVVLTRDLHAAGHVLWVIPEAVVTHARGSSCVRLGSRARFRHLLGGLVRYLDRTQPPYRRRLFRWVMIVNHLAKTATGRTTALGWFDLLAALDGDLGPLPDGDTRPWDVVVTGSPPPDPERRQLVVDLTGGRGPRLDVEQTGASRWVATIGATVPLARRTRLVRWVNLRVAGARLRSWLDGQAGPRTLHVGLEHAPLARWLGEDVAVPAPSTTPDLSAAPVAGRPWVIMLSGSPWASGAHRQHAIAAELSVDYRVLFVDPPSNGIRPGFAVTPVGARTWQVRVATPAPAGRQLAPVNRLTRRLTAHGINRWLAGRPGDRVLWVDEDLAAPLIGRLGEDVVVYDATDLDWSFTRSWNRPHLRRGLRSAVGRAELVLASSTALPPRLPPSRRPPVVVPNACDPESFLAPGAPPAWLDRQPRPRLGYVGAIDDRALDAELLAAVARRRPGWTFVLVGPATRRGRTALTGLSNVILSDAVPFGEVPSLLAGFDLGLIPYRVGGLIDYVHPKKTFEYLAAGLPVVATPLPALVDLAAGSPPGLLRLAADADGFLAAVEAALAQSGDPVEVGRRRELAAQHSWAARGREIRELLAAARADRGSGSGSGGGRRDHEAVA